MTSPYTAVNEVRTTPAKLTEREQPVLWALNEISQPDGEMCVPFKYIASTLGRGDIAEVRRVTRQLARKGLAEYFRGLFTDDGRMAGSGYCITQKGRAIASAESSS